MTGYKYTKRSVHSAWLAVMQSEHFFEGNCNQPWREQTHVSVIVTSHEKSEQEVSTLFMAGYNCTKRSVHSLHDWLQLH
jgi:hypothetical protein